MESHESNQIKNKKKEGKKSWKSKMLFENNKVKKKEKKKRKETQTIFSRNRHKHAFYVL